MTDSERKNGFADLEEYLERIVLRPAPPGLRDRVLRAAGSRRRTRVLSGAAQWQLAGCAVVLAVIVFGDAAVSRRQVERFGALLDGKGRNGGAVVAEEQRRLFLEEIALGGDAEDDLVLEKRLAFRDERREEASAKEKTFYIYRDIWEEDQASYDIAKNPK